MRVNARLQPEVAQKLTLLKAATGASTSDVLKCAIDAYFQQAVGRPQLPYPALQNAGFIGCASGPPNLSRTYKARLGRSLGKKYGHR